MSVLRQGNKFESRLPLPLDMEMVEILYDTPYVPTPENEGHGFMQTEFWARFKIRTGWRAYCLKVASQDWAFSDKVIVLARSLGFGQWFAYVPHGPVNCPGALEPADYLFEIVRFILPKLPARPLFVRFDIPWSIRSPESQKLSVSIASFYRGIRKGKPVQVPDTTILDLRLSESELLERMKPKWRYNIRLAEKKGVIVRRDDADALDSFYGLYLTTAKRDGIAIHPKSYYADLLDEGKLYAEKFPGRKSPVSVWLAYHDNEILAGIITIFTEKEAVYLYGASSDVKRNLMPAYALQWSAIRAARDAGCTGYDFFGIPPGEDSGHAMAGLYLFKTGFGGSIVHRFGSVDIPVRTVATSVFSALEGMRNFWHKKIVKKSVGFLRFIKSKMGKSAL